jgi:chemotaxis protein histidine kinase CheA/CheY-like chemotaxis protein
MSAAPDPSLVPIFETEVAEIVGTLQSHLLRLEQGASDSRSRIEDMLRLTHDVKGSARVVGYQHVSRLAHAFESRLLRWRGLEAVPSSEVGLALAACDLISSLTTSREAPEPVARAAELEHSLEEAPIESAAPTAGSPRLRTPAIRTVKISDSLRVPRDRLDNLSDAVADALVTVLGSTERMARLRRASQELRNVRVPRPGASRRELARARGELDDAIQHIRDAVSELGKALIPLDADIRNVDTSARDLFLVDFAPLATHLERVARDTATLLGREIEFTVEGRDSHIDKELADVLKGPLAHAVRNAVDHGIEPPAEREAAGKPRVGRVTLTVAEDGPSLRLTVRDDGRGIDREAVRARLGPEVEGLDDRQLFARLLSAGVSTRDTVTEISGRGVGLSSLAVVTQELRGDVDLSSEAQRGTTVALRLPLKLSLIRGLIVRAAGSRFVVPEERLVSIRRPWPGAPPLAALLGLPAESASEQVLVLRGRRGPVGVTVDQIDGIREVVRRPLGAHLGRAPFVEGVTILGNGEPALILDAREVAEACPQAAPDAESSAEPLARARRVLIVDDSATLRATLQQVLTRAGFEVGQAGDGLEALAQLSRTTCHAIVSDVQMPRMDGWQLLDHCGGRVPFVLMTARPEPGGVSRARQSGACAYLVKDDALGERVASTLNTALSSLLESRT